MSAVTHVGIGVPELEPAARWYRRVLGFEPLGPVATVRAHEGHAGTVAADVLGPQLRSFRQAQLVGSNGVGLELFEFDGALGELRSGLFHICLVAQDVSRTAARIAAAGGRRSSDVWPVFEGEPYLTCYCEDPFGNLVELHSHRHERVYANR